MGFVYPHAMNLPQSTFFEYELTSGNPADIIAQTLTGDSVSLVNTINANAFNVALQDEVFHDSLLASDFLVADGIGVVWAGRLFGARGLNKIAGFDLFSAAMDIADRDRLSVGFLGSTPEVLEKIVANCEKDYPGASVKVLSPPFAPQFSDAEARDMVNEIGRVDILFIGMTAPKQEKFAYQVRSDAPAKVVLAVGAVFDFYAGTTKRAHPLFIKLGLEWLGRSIADPKRLGKRNLIAIPTFLFNCFRLKLGRKRS